MEKDYKTSTMETGTKDTTTMVILMVMVNIIGKMALNIKVISSRD